MEGIELRKALEEAHPLVGARLSKVHQVGEVFFLRFYRPSGALALDPGAKAFHRTALRPPTPPSPPPFCVLLRSLTGQPLVALEQAGLDRVVRLRFLGGDVVLDLRPRQGDLFLVPRDGEAASFRGGTLRAVDFAAPADPSSGLGPDLRRAAAAHFGHPPGPEELAAFATDLLARAPAGYVYRTGERSTASFFPRPDLGEPRLVLPAFWQALDVQLEGRLGTESARDQATQIARALARRERALAALAAAEGEAQRWPEIQAQADLILTRIADIPRGAAEVVVEGFDGKPVTLHLDPALPPAAQATALYAKAKKLRRRLEGTPIRRRALEEEISRLRALQDLLARRPDLAPYLDGQTQDLASSPKPARTPPRATPRETTVDGFRILIGRSGEENDQLVRAARPDDVWLHARGVPGAHVLIRTDGRPVPREVLVRAAELAAWHSRGRGERKVAVSYTEARYVRKPKGVPPGMVTLLREEVLVVGGDRGP
ncbi:DUF814 domain-containing protein [Candidatus Bipolaricaulota bacterium]|nr:DUF814 domain-containing protein [Candidatus Bipolaricaulota bacterium]